MSNVEVKDEYVASSDETVCSSCGKTMIENGESIVAKLIYHPGTFKIINYHIKNYICQFCEEKEADKNVDIFNENLVSPSLVSHIINFKYNYAIPLYRQEDIFKRDGLPISRVSLSKYIELAAEALTPLYELMIKDLVSTDSKVLQADETSFKCIMDCQAEGDSEDRDKNYVYTYATTYYDSPIRIYSYSKK